MHKQTISILWWVIGSLKLNNGELSWMLLFKTLWPKYFLISDSNIFAKLIYSLNRLHTNINILFNLYLDETYINANIGSQAPCASLSLVGQPASQPTTWKLNTNSQLSRWGSLAPVSVQHPRVAHALRWNQLCKGDPPVHLKINSTVQNQSFFS